MGENRDIIESQIQNLKYFKEKERDITCTICNGILIDPLICSKCEIPYCNKCINEWLTHFDYCPLQCKPIKLENINEKLRTILEEISVKCQNGCITSLLDYNSHICKKTFKFKRLTKYSKSNSLPVIYEETHKTEEDLKFKNKSINKSINLNQFEEEDLKRKEYHDTNANTIITNIKTRECFLHEYENDVEDISKSNSNNINIVENNNNESKYECEYRNSSGNNSANSDKPKKIIELKPMNLIGSMNSTNSIKSIDFLNEEFDNNPETYHKQLNEKENENNNFSQHQNNDMELKILKDKLEEEQNLVRELKEANSMLKCNLY